ncbi:MAG: chemotaxis protein CheW [Candidatus Edwardsbacteria bacterium]|jgi:chemotaxis signal transduction protein|nr:chemotaxis protein CheW [Candidatus Edwardsbacteria bacterium]
MTAGRDQRWLLCECLGETFGLELSGIQEIIYRPSVLALPGLEPPRCGLVLWQGRSLTMVSLRLLRGRPEPPVSPVAVIVADGGRQAGLLADGIGETVRGPELFPLHPSLCAGRAYLTRAFLWNGAAVFVLDLGILLAGLAPQTGRPAAPAD